MALHLVRSLRHVHRCQLPVTIAYCGENDLPEGSRRLLQSVDPTGVELLDICSGGYSKLKGLGLRGYEIKGFAALFAGEYRQAIMMDADAVFLKSPEALFDDPAYLDTGALYFRDRVGDEAKAKGVADFLRNAFLPSDTLKRSRLYSGVSWHEQESGVVVIDRHKQWRSLLASCALMGPRPARRHFFGLLHGDKEAFWLGAEAVGAKYSWAEPRCGVIGNVAEDGDGAQMVCGKILHFDREGRPYWLNGGILSDHRNLQSSPRRLTHYSMEARSDIATMCNHGAKPVALGAKEAADLESIARLWVGPPGDTHQHP